MLNIHTIRGGVLPTKQYPKYIGKGERHNLTCHSPRLPKGGQRCKGGDSRG